ncbi:MAG: M23 family metallopeptidase [Betaproteobacteria bacterium]|jgi:murein DD-endopeptidase MepM/ murein hydrolase activator NlpD|nr:M23 family metallopeptidase [Betaproteobacteria bacterium]
MRRFILRRPERLWTLGPAVFGVLMAAITAFGLSGISEAESRVLSQKVAIEIKPEALEHQMKALAAHGLELTREDEVRKNDSFESLLERLGVEDRDARQYLRKDARTAAILRNSAGQTALVRTDLEGRLLRLQLLNKLDAWIVERTGEGQFTTRTARLGSEMRIEHRSVQVGRSFYGAMDEAGVPEAITEQVVTLFESDLDFRRQVSAGDIVRVIYENQLVGGRDIGAYKLMAVRFEAGQKTYEALYFEHPETRKGNYYDAQGRSVKRGFLAEPLRYTRMSSGFTTYRLHPLFGDPRAHRGVDYAAPYGTPVRSVADGVVVSKGWSTGYGNTVEIKHNERYSTLYAHLSDYAPKLVRGKNINMGEVIGFVGTTGWATGPHLHYEFRVNGRHVDPSRIIAENPQVPSLSGSALKNFEVAATDLRGRLSLLDNVNTARAQ